MMKMMSNKCKYMLASVMLANMFACNTDDLAQLSQRQDLDSGTRTAELVSKAISLDAAGTLEAKVSESMGDAAIFFK